MHPAYQRLSAGGLLGQWITADYRIVAATIGVLLVLVTILLLRPKPDQ